MELVQAPKRPKATILLIHGLGSSSEVWNKIKDQFPEDLRVVTVDLLGFGKSPKPDWAEYDAYRQAQSVIHTYRLRRLGKRAIVVGHSMGGIVAVEIAKHYPALARSLILCSPPFYKLDLAKKSRLPSREKVLIDIYHTINKHPERFAKVAARAVKYKLIDKSYRLGEETLPSYVNALQAAIINQSALRDAAELRIPIDIIHGSLDPVVVRSNLKYLADVSKNVTLSHVRAGHEINAVMTRTLITKIKDHAGIIRN
jgi:pimeloyl-ACP methyl ester carboxylesterase